MQFIQIILFIKLDLAQIQSAFVIPTFAPWPLN